MVKRLMLVCVMMLCLVPLSGWADPATHLTILTAATPSPVPPTYHEPAESTEFPMEPAFPEEFLREEGDLIWNWGTSGFDASRWWDIFPIIMDPEEAYGLLNASYKTGGLMKMNELLASWGLDRIIAVGQPVYHIYIADGQEQPLAAVIGFPYDYEQDYSLLFRKGENGWLLTDVLKAECVQMKRCGIGARETWLLELCPDSYGSSRDIEIYDLRTGRIEAGYTVWGFSYIPNMHMRVLCSGEACYDEEGLHTCRMLTLQKWDVEICDYVEICSVQDIFDYAVDENGGLMRLFDFDPSTIVYPGKGSLETILKEVGCS